MQRRVLKSMQRRELKSKEDFPTVICIFVDDWQQNTNSFVLRKKLFSYYHLDPNKGSKGVPKGIQRGFKGDPKGGYPRRLLKSKQRRMKSMLRRLF
jgi:hypothetical protein